MHGRGGGWVAVQVVLLALIFLSALVGLEWPAPAAPFAYAAGALLLALGLALLVAGGVALGDALTPYPAPREGQELRTSGAYAYVRHPMYGGGILLAVGWSLVFATVAGLVLTVALTVFADLKSRHEETRLARVYPGYAEYRARVRRRLVPFVW